MNIETASLSSPVLSGSAPAGENVSLPVTDGSVVPDGFSGALTAQIELLSSASTGTAVPSQPQTQILDTAGGQVVASLQDAAAASTAANAENAAGAPPTEAVDMQDVAVLAGNNLPLTYKHKDETGHEAALSVVSDSLKYMTANVGSTDKTGAQQNINDLIAMAVPSEQGAMNMAATVVPVKPDLKPNVASVQQDKNAKQKTETEQNIPVIDVPVQTVPVPAVADNSGQKPDEQKNDTSSDASAELAASLLLPSMMPSEPAKSVNNLTPDNTIKQETALTFSGDASMSNASSPAVKILADKLPGAGVLVQTVQDKQDAGLSIAENSDQVGKNGQVGAQVSSAAGEKNVSTVGVDMAQINKAGVDNKTEAPAITKPLSHPEWNKDLGDRIVWMNNKSIPTAEIRLNPQHLGPISVRVNVSDDQASVVFTAQHAVVRETLEASIPKLREMMSAQNLNLTDVNIAQSYTSDQGRSQSQNSAQGFAGDNGGKQGSETSGIDGSADNVEQEIESGRAVVSKGVLSLYA